MRLGFFLGWLSALSAWGAEVGVEHLSRQLAQAEDLRQREQLVVALGGIAKEEVVVPLCRAVRDKEPLVRQAAVKSLARLPYFSRLPCLESAMADSNKAVRNEAIEALQWAGRRLANYGFVLEDAQPSLKKSPVDNLSIAMQILRSQLSNMGAHVAQGKERTFKQPSIDKRYKLRLKAFQEGESLKLEMLVMTFPKQSLKAHFSVQARGKTVSVSKVLEKMVQKLIEEAMEELKW